MSLLSRNLMKKAAFITPNYTGATLPIVKELLRLGWKVDYYFPFGMEPSNGEHPKEAMILRNFHAKMGLHEIPPHYFQELYDYMDSDSFRMYYYRTSRPFKTVPIIRDIVSIWRRIEHIPVLRYVRKQKYDLINLVCNFDYNDFLFFHKNLNVKIITSFHEVCNHWQPDFDSPTPFLNYLFHHTKEIVVHSKNSYRDILQYKGANKDKIHHINFGIFETFKTIKGSANFKLPQNYVLFFGVFRSYKGLSYLLKAIKDHPECLGNNHLVIAGSGHDDSIQEFRQIDNVHVINRYIKNEEVIYLLEHCQFVICPYTTMSQSGLPQTIYAFNKPIVASDLDGFREIVIHKKTGLLFESKNTDELASAVKELSSNAELYQSIVSNILDFKNVNEPYSWPFITQQYLSI